MNLHISWELVTLICAVLAHAFATVKWGATISANINAINTTLQRLDRELEKRDVQISAIWERIDELRDMVDKKE